MSGRSSVSPPQPRQIGPFDKWLVDPVTGAIIGVQNPNAGGEDGQFYPIPLTAAQILNPSADMVADIYVTYALNISPYDRYRSDGVRLVPLDPGGAETIIKYRQVFYSPFTVEGDDIVSVEGNNAELRVISWPA